MHKHTCTHILSVVYTTDSGYPFEWSATMNIRYPPIFPFTCINNCTIDTWKAIQSRSFFLILRKGEKREYFKICSRNLQSNVWILLKDILNLKLRVPKGT